LVLALVLALAGFEVWAAATGEEAVALYRRHRDAFDVVLLDVRMPGMDAPRRWPP
jgi:CheY-like chemotaxis protein